MGEIMMARLRYSEACASVLPVTWASEYRLGMIRGDNKMPDLCVERQGDCNARSKCLQYDSHADSCAH
jgi:hypothetical protein